MMDKWYSNIYKAFILAGIVSFIIGIFADPKTSLGAYISGYSLFILSIMMIMTILFSNILKITENDNISKQFYSILVTGGPFIIILGIISFLLFQLIKYKNNISQGHIANSYYSFTNITIMLILLQFYIVYTNINTNRFENTGKFSSVTTSIVYLLGIITGICSIILYTILKYYSTDGFRI